MLSPKISPLKGKGWNLLWGMRRNERGRGEPVGVGADTNVCENVSPSIIMTTMRMMITRYNTEFNNWYQWLQSVRMDGGL